MPNVKRTVRFFWCISCCNLKGEASRDHATIPLLFLQKILKHKERNQPIRKRGTNDGLF